MDKKKVRFHEEYRDIIKDINSFKKDPSLKIYNFFIKELDRLNKIIGSSIDEEVKKYKDKLQKERARQHLENLI